METPLEKYSWFNFNAWKVKIHMHLMNKNLWGIVKGIETTLGDLTKVLEWKSRDDKSKAIIDLALTDSELYHIDLEDLSKYIWENLSKLFGAVNAKF